MHHERIAAHLRWYYLESDGALGLHSNYAAMALRLQGSSSSTVPSTELDGRQLAAAHRARRVKATLDQLPKSYRDVLAAAYGGREACDLVAVIVRLDQTTDEYRRSRTTRQLSDWLARLARNSVKKNQAERQRLYAKLKKSAELTLTAALDAYGRHEKR